MTSIPNPDMHALVSGESVVAFVPRHTLDEGEEITLEAAGPRSHDEVKVAYARWNEAPIPAGPWTGVVVSLAPSSVLDPVSGSSRHVLNEVPEGDVAVIRVYGPGGPVLSDETFDARRAGVDGASEP